MEAFRREHMSLEEQMKRAKRHRAGADLVGERRQTELHPFTRIALALPVERLVLAELLEQELGQERRTEQPARGGVKRRRRLGDGLARPAREALAHGLHDLPAPGHHLQRLRHVLAELGQAVRAATRAAGGHRDDHTLARQMVGQGLACRSCSRERLDRSAGRDMGGERLLLARGRLQLLEPELELVDEQAPTLGALAEQRTPHLLVLEFEQRHPGRQIRVHSAGARRLGFRLRQRRLERRDIAGKRCRHCSQA